MTRWNVKAFIDPWYYEYTYYTGLSTLDGWWRFLRHPIKAYKQRKLEKTLSRMMAEEITKEIDNQIIQEILENAKNPRKR